MKDDNPFAAPLTTNKPNRTEETRALRLIWSNAVCCVVFMVAGMWNTRTPFGGYLGSYFSYAGVGVLMCGCLALSIHATLCWRWVHRRD